MSIFSKLNKTERAKVFSGQEFEGDKLPSGEIMPDGSVLVATKEGWNTFRMVSCPSGKAVYGSKSIWQCDVNIRGMQRILERAIELKEVVIL